MSALILDSLEIKRFRTFRHLRLERLGRVNLVVGKNNVGKSCLLEALWLNAHRGAPFLIRELLEARDESSRPRMPEPPIQESIQDYIFTIKHLFHGRRDIREPLERIEIGPSNSRRERLVIAVEWLVKGELRRGQASLFEDSDEADEADILTPALTIEMGAQPTIHYPLEGLFLRRQWIQFPEQRAFPSVFVGARGLDSRELSTLWDNVALTDLEGYVLDALGIIAPEVERVNLVSRPEFVRERIPIVRVADYEDRIPLRSLGEGMNRLFGVALALVNAANGLFLIDEIESGLHYSVQPDLWRLVFETARRLNIQVFATTHSWDCIEAFQIAASEHKEEGVLIRLQDKQGEIDATVFDEGQLAIATREQIEIR